MTKSPIHIKLQQPHRRTLFKAIAALMSMTVVSGLAIAQTASPTVLRFSDHEPLGGMRTRFLKEVFFPAIEQESKGRLKVEDHWNGELAGPYEALGSVGKLPTVDMATVVPEYTAKELPLHQIFKSFPVGPTGDKQVQFFRRVYQEVSALNDELAKNDLVSLYFGTGYPVAFYSTTPIDDVKYVAGNKWRSASFWYLDFLRNAGATPVTMHWGPEVAAALKNKTLDGLMVNVDSGYMLKAHEMAPNVLVSKDLWLGHLYLVAMKKSVWEGLAAEDKDAIGRAAERSYRTLGRVMDESFNTQIDDLQKAGAKVRTLSLAEAQTWQTMTQYRQIQDAWTAKQQTQGVNNAAAVLQQVSTILAASLH